MTKYEVGDIQLPLSMLAPKQVRVIEERLKGKTYREIGESFGVSGQRAWQILISAIFDEGGIAPSLKKTGSFSSIEPEWFTTSRNDLAPQKLRWYLENWKPKQPI